MLRTCLAIRSRNPHGHPHELMGKPIFRVTTWLIRGSDRSSSLFRPDALSPAHRQPGLSSGRTRPPPMGPPPDINGQAVDLVGDWRISVLGQALPSTSDRVRRACASSRGLPLDSPTHAVNLRPHPKMGPKSERLSASALATSAQASWVGVGAHRHAALCHREQYGLLSLEAAMNRSGRTELTLWRVHRSALGIAPVA